MQLPLQDFPTLVRNMAAGAQGACRQALDFTTGSILRAIAEANASLALWMQWLIVQVLATTRAATSTGGDLDSWMADFGVSRLAARPAHGAVLFSRGTPGFATTVPVGALVRTGDAALTFGVAADPGNPAWSGAGYALPAGALGVLVPVVASGAGSAGNVQAGTVTLLATAVPGVDAVSNPTPLLGGLDGEPDSALRARFFAFMDSRSRATLQAAAFAILSTQQGVRYAFAENVDAAGAHRPGNFVITVDDGTGAPGQALIAAVTAAVDAVRPIGSTFQVRAPAVVRADVALRVGVAPGASLAAATPAIWAAVAGWIEGLGIGEALPLSRVTALAFAASPAVARVSGVTLNGEAADLVPPTLGRVRPGNVVVSADGG